MTNYYGFRYADGPRTTTGEGEAFRIAGQLYRFDSPAAAADWVQAGMTHRERACMAEDGLPNGWTSDMAEVRTTTTTKDDITDPHHVTRVSGPDVYGHPLHHCSEVGCNNEREEYLGTLDDLGRTSIEIGETIEL